jgi:hypothetical protein
VGGLSPATGYAWRAVGVDPFGLSTLGATDHFTTLAESTATPGTTPTPTPTSTQTPPATPRTAIACAAGKRAHGRTTVTCTVKLVVTRSGAVRATLRRGARAVASGAGRLTRGSAKLRLSARKKLAPGRYTLVIKAGKATISTSAVRIGR